MRTMRKSLLHFLLVLWAAVAAKAFQVNLASNRRNALVELYSIRDGQDENTRFDIVSRRGIISNGLALLLVVAGSWNDNDDKALAFPNKISTKYDDVPKRRGPQPTDLGVATRKGFDGDEYLGLKNCKASPNCFSSTDSELDDPEHFIPAWIWPPQFGNDKEKAFLQLQETILAYQPGQNNVDGGGFQIAKCDPQNGYMYAQFEALKGGYIDDVEFAYIDEGRLLGDHHPHAVQVRSSSRVGYLDYGVNAKRLNYIAKALRSQGWDAPGVDFSLHPDYAYQNGL